MSINIESDFPDGIYVYLDGEYIVFRVRFVTNGSVIDVRLTPKQVVMLTRKLLNQCAGWMLKEVFECGTTEECCRKIQEMVR